VGFSDAEGNFSIVGKKGLDGLVGRFSFMFTIRLHKDDMNVLIKIKTLLNLGRVNTSNDECIFVVTKQEDIRKLISIFDKYNLNTSKYLDYLDLKKAFILYYERTGLVSQELIEQILILKDGMNTLRTNFEINPSHKINISKY
jgi:hypothetical protein